MKGVETSWTCGVALDRDSISWDDVSPLRKLLGPGGFNLHQVVQVVSTSIFDEYG